jgi:pyruvate/2-oxoglutarate dehydrogenase complex dihydrolipoamide dehydrogenase (E3) component
MDVVVIGAGPAGVMAALRAAELGARTALVTSGEFGGMAANDGPIPVRTLAHAARLIRGTRQLERYGIAVGEPRLALPRLLDRVREVVEDVRARSGLREQVDRLGVTLHERAGTARFVDPHTIECASGLRLQAAKFVLCAGGRSRPLPVPGSELTVTHSHAWSLTEVPRSMLVIGGGMTGLQVASIFHALGSRVRIFQRGPRILAAEEVEVSTEVASAMRGSGIELHESFGTIEGFERTADGVRMIFSKDGTREIAEGAIAVVAIGWEADTTGLGLAAAGVQVDARGFVKVDEFMATSVGHIFAAGDITGRSVLVPPAVLDAHVAGTNAVRGPVASRADEATPRGGFTDPEYARVGLTESEARRDHDAVAGLVRFEETARAIIDGQAIGFCKLIADRRTRRILGCHVVGERAADIVQAVAIAMAGGLAVDELARVPLAFPTYVGILSRAAYRVSVQIDPATVSPVSRVVY